MPEQSYLLPIALYILSYLALLPKDKKFRRYFIVLVYAGFICQSIIFFVSIGLKGFAAPANMDMFVFFNSWILMLIVVLFGIYYKIESILLYITPFVAFNLILGFLVPHTPMKSIVQAAYGPILLTHIILILVGDSLFALAFIISLMYIFQERKIKDKKNLKLFEKNKDIPLSGTLYTGGGYNLELLDNINYQCLKIGFPFITAGIIMGIYLSAALFNTFLLVRPIEIMSIITWLIYAILLHERIARGVRGGRAAVFSVVGFLLILFSLGFSFYFFPSFHGLG